MEQDSARGASAVLLMPLINVQRAMGPGTAEWHVAIFLVLSSSCVLKRYRYGTLYRGTSVVGLDLSHWPRPLVPGPEKK